METQERIQSQFSPHIYYHIAEGKYYTASVKHEAFSVMFQFDEPNNREDMEK